MMKLKNSKSNGEITNFLTIFVFSVLACVPILLYGIPNSSDMAQHFQFALTFYDSFKAGEWYPGWSSFTNHGFGDVGVRFYPPFSYYVLILFRSLLGDWFYASCAAFQFWFFVGGVGIYLWAKEWFSSRSALFAAVIYIFVPYHVNELYNSFLYAEFAASGILPFCFLFVTRICRRSEKISDAVGLAIAYALLILTNLPLALIGSISLLIYSLVSLDKNKFFSPAIKLGLSVSLGLLASSFYWLKMLLEINFVKHNTAQYTLERYDFRTNFAFSYLFTEGDAQILKTLSYLDTMMLVTLGVFLPCIFIYYLYRQKAESPKLLNVLVVLVLSVFLSCFLSAPVWENIPFLQKIQFPWRWLAIISLCGVIFNAAAFEIVLKFLDTEKRWLAFLTFGLILTGFAFTAIKIMRPIYQYPRADFNQLVERLRTTGSYECWMPVWVKNDELSENQLSARERPREIVSDKQTEKIIHFPAGKPLAAEIKVFYYPHWQATVNGAKTEVGKAENGAILLNIPPEETSVKLEFVEPFYTRAANFVSAFAWLLLFCFGAFFTFARNSFKNNESVL